MRDAMRDVAVRTVPHSRPWITDADRLAVAASLDSAQLANGALVARFEAMVASAMQQRHAIATSSGTAALTVALLALQLPRGADVIVPTYVCDDVARAVRAAGLTPRWCDVGNSWCLTAETVRAALTPNCVAVIAVHMFGRLADVRGIAALGLPVVADACQAFGAQDGDVRACTGALVTVASFHATKCLTTGEGGALLTDDMTIALRARAIASSDGVVTFPTVLSDLQAALGIAQLDRYPTMLARRAELSTRWDRILSQSMVVQSSPRAPCATPLFRYTLCIADPFEMVAAAFAAQHVIVRRGVDSLRHRTSAPDSAFPVAARLWATTVSLPVHASLTDDDWQTASDAAHAVWGNP